MIIVLASMFLILPFSIGVIIGVTTYYQTTTKAKDIVSIESFSQNVIRNCERYESSLNEIQKSQVFRENEAYLHHVSLQNIEGQITKIYTNQGGSTVDITIVTPFGEFYNSNIASTTPIYQVLSTTSIGQCMRFSGVKIEANSIFEHSKVCDKDYRIQLTSIVPCDKTTVIEETTLKETDEDQSFIILTSDKSVLSCMTLTKLSTKNPTGTISQVITPLRQGIESGKLALSTQTITNCNIDDKSHVSVGICNFYLPNGIRAYSIAYDLKSINGSQFNAKKGAKAACDNVKGEWTDAENDWSYYSRVRGRTQVL